MALFSRRSGERRATTPDEPDEKDTVVQGESINVGDSPGPPVDLVKARIETRQEWVRAILAVLFVVLLGLIVVWAFTRTTSWRDTIELLDRVLPAVTGLLGSVVGFYFATRRGSD
jgi:hypothetical protein